jgi:hypothetical protein
MAAEMMALGLDLSVETGFCFGTKASTPHYAVWSLPGFDDRNIFRSMGSIMTSVKAVVAENKVWRVAIEAPLALGGRSAHTQRVLTMLAGAAAAGAVEGGAGWIRMPAPNTWRKAVLGCGFPKNTQGKSIAKQAALDYCRLNGWQPEDDNAADALCIWWWAVTQV